ncbi:hypothetical protein GOODEAATRI_024030 [Goodea atripinnis]|uniref:THAP domain-containing protein 1 n=1 Tax=Goodea atripinnis TaxID=208336 RepID=A0ABV0MUP3_9TELE
MLSSYSYHFCDGTVKLGVSMHFFPKDPVLRRKWEQFVQVKRQNFHHASPYSVLCSKHFEADDYESSMMQMFGFKAKNNTRLKKDAVPTIHAPNPKPVLVDPETGLCSRPAGQPPTSSPSLVRNRYTSKVSLLSSASVILPAFSAIFWSTGLILSGIKVCLNAASMETNGDIKAPGPLMSPPV